MNQMNRLKNSKLEVTLKQMRKELIWNRQKNDTEPDWIPFNLKSEQLLCSTVCLTKSPIKFEYYRLQRSPYEDSFLKAL